MHFSAPQPDETDSEGRRVVTVNDNRYVIISTPPARPQDSRSTTWTGDPYVRYQTERDGKAIGPVRYGRPGDKPGSTQRGIWEAATRK